MIGMAMSARMTEAFKTFRPTDTPNHLMISGLITVIPMNPQTILGMAASNSMMIFSHSRSFPLQNSDRKIAPPIANGTAMTIATTVTLSVPMISRRTP